MTQDWKSTIHNAYPSLGGLSPVLQETIPALIKNEIQQLANSTLFQNNVRSRSISSQVPVDMRVTDSCLNIRISNDGPWISLLPSSEPLNPEQRAVDAVRRDIMKKIALLWGEISGDSSTESDSADRSFFGSSKENPKSNARTRSKRSRSNEKNKRISSDKEPSTNISRNRIDCSTHTTNNYYYCVGSQQEPSITRRQENPQTPTPDTNREPNPIFNPVFRNQNTPRNYSKTSSSEDSSDDESDYSSTSSFSDQSYMKSKHFFSSSISDTSESDNEDLTNPNISENIPRSTQELHPSEITDSIIFSAEEAEQGSSDSLHRKSDSEDKNLTSFSNSDVNKSEDPCDDESDHSSISSSSCEPHIEYKILNSSTDSDINESDDEDPTTPLLSQNIYGSTEELYGPEDREDFTTLSDSDINNIENELSSHTAINDESDQINIQKKRFVNKEYNTESSDEKIDDKRVVLSENNQEFVENEILDSYEFIQTSDVENIPAFPASTISIKHSTPIFLSPKNPFHLEKYSHLLRVIKGSFTEFSSDSNLDELKSILNQENLDSREKYRQYVDLTRKLLRDTTLESSTRERLEKLCYDQFTRNVMTNFIEQFLHEATNNSLKSPSELSMYTIADAIIATNDQLKNSPSKKELLALYSQKLAGELGINFDPTKYSNIPEIRSIHTVKSSSKNKPYEIIYMRHGTPTIETGIINAPQHTDNFLTHFIKRLGSTLLKNYNATTVPEYGAFLNRSRDLNQAVLYVNHQNMTSETSREYSRSRAIQNHETTHPTHFFFMALPLDGVMLNYVEDTDEWKRGLIDSLMQEKNGFRLPVELKKYFYKDKDTLEKQFIDLLDQLHNLYFGSKPLNHKDQQILLMIFYSYLKDFVKEKYQIQIMVSACKDNKDRGNTSSSIDEAIYNLRLGRENDSNALYDLYIRFFAPFIIKYEHIVPRRFKLLLGVLEHITILTDSQKQAIRQFQINDFEILDQKVPH
ncbi:MAG: hypothetical protein ACRCSV_04930 [Chlamydiales bacterium]